MADDDDDRIISKNMVEKGEKPDQCDLARSPLPTYSLASNLLYSRRSKSSGWSETSTSGTISSSNDGLYGQFSVVPAPFAKGRTQKDTLSNDVIGTSNNRKEKMSEEVSKAESDFTKYTPLSEEENSTNNHSFGCTTASVAFGVARLSSDEEHTAVDNELIDEEVGEVLKMISIGRTMAEELTSVEASFNGKQQSDIPTYNSVSPLVSMEQLRQDSLVGAFSVRPGEQGERQQKGRLSMVAEPEQEEGNEEQKPAAVGGDDVQEAAVSRLECCDTGGVQGTALVRLQSGSSSCSHCAGEFKQEEIHKKIMFRKVFIISIVTLLMIGIVVGVSLWNTLRSNDTPVSPGGLPKQSQPPTSQPSIGAKLQPPIPPVVKSWVQVGQNIVSSSPADKSGRSIDLSFNGSVLVTGIGLYNSPNGEENIGMVQSYELNLKNNTWDHLGQSLFGTNTADMYGSVLSVSSDGGTIAVGSQNTQFVKVYTFSMEQQLWIQLGQDVYFDPSGAASLLEVCLSSDGLVLAIGSSAGKYTSNSAMTNIGQVYVFRINKTVIEGTSHAYAWEQLGQRIGGTYPEERFGSTLSLADNGLIIAIGVNTRKQTGSKVDTTQHGTGGRIEIMTYDADANIWETYGSAQNNRTNIGEEYAFGRFGRVVSLSAAGDIVAVGSPENDDIQTYAGRVVVFQLNPKTSVWEQLGQDIVGDGRGDYTDDESGYVWLDSKWLDNKWVSLSSDGKVLAIGASKHDGRVGFDSGIVRIFEYNSLAKSWEQSSQLEGEASFDNFGQAVRLSGDGRMIAIGIGGASLGSVRIFQKRV